MPLLNVFAAKELDDWSGKKTVKTGQVCVDTTTTTSSVETELALPVKHGYIKTHSLLEPCKEIEACSKSGSSTDVSSDDNSTFVVSEGRFVEQLIEKLHESDSDDGDTLDALSLDGLGAGCMECGDFNVDIESPETVDSEAHEYWKRVTANRKRSMVGKVTIQDVTIQDVPIQDLPSQSYDTATEEDETEKYADKTEIEVVHTGMRSNYNSEPETGKDSDKSKSRSFRKLVQTLSTKIPRPAKSDEIAKADGDSTPEATVCIEKEDGCEVELKPSQPSGFSKLAKMLSKTKLFSQEEAIASPEYSCASSTEDKWALFGDKYKTPDEISISDTGKELDEEVESELENIPMLKTVTDEVLEVPHVLEAPDVEELDPSAGAALSETRPSLPERSKSMRDSLKKTGTAAKRAIRALPERSESMRDSLKKTGTAAKRAIRALPERSESMRDSLKKTGTAAKRAIRTRALPRRSKSMRDSLKKTGTAAKRAIKSRASLMRNAMNMKYDSSAFSASGSNDSRVSKSSATTEQLSAESKKLSKTTNIGEHGRRNGSERLRQLGKSLRLSVSRIKKMSSKEESVSEPSLVVCIDGKGDRVNPNKDSDSESGRKTNSSRENENHQEASNDGENSVVGSTESRGLVVEVDGPGVCRMCMRDCSNISLAHSRARGRYAIGDEDNSLCSSMISDGRNTVFSDNTGWFLAKGKNRDAPPPPASEPKKVVKRCKSEDNLSRFGVESPYEDFPPEMIDSMSQFEESTESSSTASDDSSNDLNSLSSSVTGSGDESILYELFPSDSFSSLAGIKCHDVGPEDSGLALACADRVSKCAPTRTSPDNENLGKAEALTRGRSKTRSLEHKSSRKLELCPTNESPEPRSPGKGFRHEDEDSIIECIGEEEPHAVPSQKAPEAECW